MRAFTYLFPGSLLKEAIERPTYHGKINLPGSTSNSGNCDPLAVKSFLICNINMSFLICLKRVHIENTTGFMSLEKFRDVRETCPWGRALNILFFSFSGFSWILTKPSGFSTHLRRNSKRLGISILFFTSFES